MSKRVTAEQLVASAWSAALAPKVEPDTVPPGWMTAAALGKLLSKNVSTITGLLQTAIKEGRAEVKKFRVPAGQRGLYPVPHYRLLK